MIPTQLDEVLVQSADTLGGAVRFKGTRIPVNILFDYVLLGGGLDEFLINYPDISKEAAQAVLSWERTQVASRFKLEIAV
jgi:uncharacterized protein (DUF433 family)